MPRFYIHVRNGHGYTPDEEGQILPDVEAAKQIAIKGGIDILSEELKQGYAFVNVTLYIEDEGHNRLMVMPISGAVEA